MSEAIANPSSSPAIVTLASKVILAAKPAMTKFADFVADFSADAVEPGTTLKIGVNTATKASTFDSSTNNYATGKESISFAPVTFAHYVDSETFTDSQLVEVPVSVFDRAGAACGRGVMLAITDAVDTAIQGLNTTATSLEVPHDGSLAKKDIAALAGATVNDPARCVLVLSRAYWAKAISLFDAGVYGGPEAIRQGRLDGGVFGFKAIQWSSKVPTGAVGVIIPEDALVVASRAVPCYAKGAYTDYALESDPETGLTVGFRQGTIVETGLNFIAGEIAFGAAFAQANSCEKIVVAAS